MLFEHFVDFFDPFIFIRLEDMSEEKCLFVTWLHDIINHQVAFVEKCQKLVGIGLNLLLNQLSESLNAFLKFLHSMGHKIDHFLSTVLHHSIIQMFVPHFICHFRAFRT